MEDIIKENADIAKDTVITEHNLNQSTPVAMPVVSLNDKNKNKKFAISVVIFSLTIITALLAITVYSPGLMTDNNNSASLFPVILSFFVLYFIGVNYLPVNLLNRLNFYANLFFVNVIMFLFIIVQFILSPANSMNIIGLFINVITSAFVGLIVTIISVVLYEIFRKIKKGVSTPV